jgi:hypothetical protein
MARPPLGSDAKLSSDFKLEETEAATREGVWLPSSATAVQESRLAASANDAGPLQQASVVLLKRPPSGTTEAAATILRSEINVPSLVAHELRTSYRDALLRHPAHGKAPCPTKRKIRRDEPQPLLKDSEEDWQTVRR